MIWSSSLSPYFPGNTGHELSFHIWDTQNLKTPSVFIDISSYYVCVIKNFNKSTTTTS